MNSALILSFGTAMKFILKTLLLFGLTLGSLHGMQLKEQQESESGTESSEDDSSSFEDEKKKKKKKKIKKIKYDSYNKAKAYLQVAQEQEDLAKIAYVYLWSSGRRIEKRKMVGVTGVTAGAGILLAVPTLGISGAFTLVCLPFSVHYGLRWYEYKKLKHTAKKHLVKKLKGEDFEKIHCLKINDQELKKFTPESDESFLHEIIKIME